MSVEWILWTFHWSWQFLLSVNVENIVNVEDDLLIGIMGTGVWTVLWCWITAVPTVRLCPQVPALSSKWRPEAFSTNTKILSFSKKIENYASYKKIPRMTTFFFHILHLCSNFQSFMSNNKKNNKLNRSP